MHNSSCPRAACSHRKIGQFVIEQIQNMRTSADSQASIRSCPRNTTVEVARNVWWPANCGALRNRSIDYRNQTNKPESNWMELFECVVGSLLCRHQQQFYRRNEKKYGPEHDRRSPPLKFTDNIGKYLTLEFIRSNVYVYLWFWHITTFSTVIEKCRFGWQEVFWTTNFRPHHPHMIQIFFNEQQWTILHWHKRSCRSLHSTTIWCDRWIRRMNGWVKTNLNAKHTVQVNANGSLLESDVHWTLRFLRHAACCSLLYARSVIICPMHRVRVAHASFDIISEFLLFTLWASSSVR